MKNRYLIFAALALLVAGCAEARPVQIYCFDDCHQYGFWGGLWHGFILVEDFFASLIWSDVVVYARNNTGRWYDAGFIIGTGTFAVLVDRISRIRFKVVKVYTRE